KLGLKAKHFGKSSLNRYEQILEKFSEATAARSSSLAGASRLVRLEHEADETYNVAQRTVSSAVAGTALFSYVVWVLQSAQKRKLDRIYFLARDGQILLKLAKMAAPTIGYQGELRYLYASRQSWRLPAAAIKPQMDLDWALDDTDFLSPCSFLERVG